MTWTATLKDVRREQLAWSVIIVYASETEKVIRSYQIANVQGDAIPDLARAEVARFESLSASDGKVPFSPGAVLDLTPPAKAPPRVPTAEEAARIAWVQDYRKLQAMQRALTAGITRSADVDAQAAKVRAAYLPEYEEFL